VQYSQTDIDLQEVLTGRMKFIDELKEIVKDTGGSRPLMPPSTSI